MAPLLCQVTAAAHPRFPSPAAARNTGRPHPPCRMPTSSTLKLLAPKVSAGTREAAVHLVRTPCGFYGRTAVYGPQHLYCSCRGRHACPVTRSLNRGLLSGEFQGKGAAAMPEALLHPARQPCCLRVQAKPAWFW